MMTLMKSWVIWYKYGIGIMNMERGTFGKKMKTLLINFYVRFDRESKGKSPISTTNYALHLYCTDLIFNCSPHLLSAWFSSHHHHINISLVPFSSPPHLRHIMISYISVIINCSCQFFYWQSSIINTLELEI